MPSMRSLLPSEKANFSPQEEKRGDCAGEITWSVWISSSSKFYTSTKLFMRWRT
jgi:hypothetical protein